MGNGYDNKTLRSQRYSYCVKKLLKIFFVIKMLLKKIIENAYVS